MYYNEQIWLETEISRFSSGRFAHNFTETCIKFNEIRGQSHANWTIMRQYTRKSEPPNNFRWSFFYVHGYVRRFL
jgi:hypothetical protein